MFASRSMAITLLAALFILLLADVVPSSKWGIDVQPIRAQTSKSARPTEPHGWQYVLLRANNYDDLIQKANSLGEQGWELVGTPCEGGFIAYFKRPKQ